MNLSAIIFSLAAAPHLSTFFSEGGEQQPWIQPDGPALILFLVLIVVVGLLLIWNALIYQAPVIEHSHAGQDGHGDEHASPAPLRKPARPDDLKIIEGIGPVTERVFKEAGILTLAQLAEKDPAELLKILREHDLNLGDPDTWPEQARLAADGDFEALNVLQEKLKWGKEVD